MRISLSLESFLKQEVICFEGAWVRRRDAIKFIANVAHGVHAGIIKDDLDRLINRVRHAAKFSLTNDVPMISFDPQVFGKVVLPAIVDRTGVDFVLVELFATVSHLANSPNIVRLVEEIGVEAAK